MTKIFKTKKDISVSITNKVFQFTENAYYHLIGENSKRKKCKMN